jgi:phosphatidylglycerophosphatase A
MRILSWWSQFKLRTQNIKKRYRVLPPVPDKVFTDPLYFFAFGLGSGAMPVAPGTFGTLMAIPIFLLIQPLSLSAYLFFVFVFILVSAWASDRVSREIGVHDHPGMCIDEFAGFFVTMIGAPQGVLWILLGFLLFRFFDIWKPWPISWVDEKVSGGLGMILDDVVAGLFAMIVMAVIQLV